MLLPRNIAELSAEEQQHIYALEQAMIAQDVGIPVFFSPYSDEFNGIIEDIATAKDASGSNDQQKLGERESALSEIVNSVSANGYQIVVTGAVHTPNKQSKIPIIQGELAPQKLLANAKNADSGAHSGGVDVSSKLPLIIITAHLDTFGLTNDQLSNVDAAVLLSLIDTFSKIHSAATTAPKYRLMFILTESGNLLNYQGTKKWIESNLEENTAVQNAEFVLCLDAIGHQRNADSLFVHVSKPPKEGTAINAFYKQLKRTAQLYGNNATVEGVHKKINLADVQLAWEHERFSMKRMPALTVSSLKSHKDTARHTMFETDAAQTLALAQRNAKIVAEALGAYVFGAAQDHGELFSGTTAITKEQVRPWLHVKSSLQNNDLRGAFEKYLKNVKVTFDKPDTREPDFMLYDGHEGTLNFYSVKPAVFDLFLTFGICMYLGAVYLAIIGFPQLYTQVCSLSSKHYVKTKSN